MMSKQRADTILRLVVLASVMLGAGCASGPSDSHVQLFLQRIEEDDADIRYQAWREAEQMDARVVVRLGELMAHEDADVAKVAREALTRVVHAAAATNGWSSPRRSVAAKLVEVLQAGHPTHVRAQMLYLLSCVGDEGAVPAIAACLTEGDVADDARMALQRIPGPAASRALIAGLQTASPDLQLRIIEALGQRGDVAAIAVLQPLVDSGDDAVSVAAMNALGRIGQPVGRHFAPETIASVPDTRLNLLADAYLHYADRRAEQNELSEASRVYAAVLRRVQESHYRCAALRGLGRTGGAGDISVLLPMTAEADPAVSEAAIQALVVLKDRPASWDRWRNRDRKTSKVNDKLLRLLGFAEPVKKAALLRIVVERGLPESQKLMLQMTSEASPGVRLAAYRLLVAHGDLNAENAQGRLLWAAREESPEIRKVAIEGLTTVAETRLVAGDRDGAMNLYHELLPLASDRESKTAVLQGIGWVGRKESASLLQPLWREGDMVEEAGTAYIAIAAATIKADDREAGVDMLRELVTTTPSPRVADAAVAQLGKLDIDTSIFARQAGFITSWHLVGTFPNEDGAAFNQVFFPETGIDLAKGGEFGGQQLEWKPVSTGRVPAIVNLREQFEQKDNVAAYAYTEISPTEERTVKLKVGSDDGIVLWLNGERLHAINGNRGVKVDGDVIPCTLQAGKNTLLLKILQAGGDWAFVVRLTDDEDKPIDLTNDSW